MSQIANHYGGFNYAEAKGTEEYFNASLEVPSMLKFMERRLSAVKLKENVRDLLRDGGVFKSARILTEYDHVLPKGLVNWYRIQEAGLVTQALILQNAARPKDEISMSVQAGMSFAHHSSRKFD